MTAHARLFGDANFLQSTESLSGKGAIMSVGHKPVAVLYKFSLDYTTGTISVINSSASKNSALREMWLEPVVILRTEDNRHTDITITDLREDGSRFEIVQDY